MKFETWFKEQYPAISIQSAEAVLKLAAEGATIPFMARYRKEQTGNLDEVAIQAVIDQKERWDEILKKQVHIIGEIDKNEKISAELKKEIKDKVLQSFDLKVLEDIFMPYRQKRKTKATKAREAGLEPLANWMWDVGHGTIKPEKGQSLDIWALTFKNDEHGIKDAEEAVGGAQDILVEKLSEMAHLRAFVRETVFEKGLVRTEKGEKAQANSKYEKYFTAQEPVSVLLKPENSHRYLAIRRGWMEQELKLYIDGEEGFEALMQKRFESEACSTSCQEDVKAVLHKAARLAFKAHVFASIESEVHSALKEVADLAAIKVFSENVRKLLMASPYGPKAVLGVDPGIRTGCKLAVVDASGKYIVNAVMHLETAAQKEEAKGMIKAVLENGQIKAIAVGNGTAGRETEMFLRSVVKELGSNVPVVMVNESGASIYSASAVAREEFPDLDVTVRGAISIARRLQDPLAELVKIDPKSIGVGQYQHDVSPHALKKSLDLVVDSCVNSVGVNLNTASYHLLSHVSGIGPSLAKSIVEYRSEKGLFKSREQLQSVSRFTKKAYEQAAGFLRIAGAENPLDNTGVHPEQYQHLQEFAASCGKGVGDIIGSGIDILKKSAASLKAKIGEFTFDDIIKELEKPGRDPREEFVQFQYREDIHEVKDLKPGMMCPGIVTNVTNFGAFVDIGVHQDGLVHISQLSDKFIKDPREVVSPGDHVQVRVVEINLEKNQIALSMKAERAAHTAKNDRPAHASRNEGRNEARGRPQPPKPSGGPTIKPAAQNQPKAAPNNKPFNNAFAGLAGILNKNKN